jgi:hypothetical protein
MEGAVPSQKPEMDLEGRESLAGSGFEAEMAETDFQEAEFRSERGEP